MASRGGPNPAVSRRRGAVTPRVMIRCGLCRKTIITYVAPHLDQIGTDSATVYVDIANEGLIKRRGANSFALQCNRHSCNASYALSGEVIADLVNGAAISGSRVVLLPPAGRSLRSQRVGALLAGAEARLAELDPAERDALASLTAKLIRA